MSVEPGELQGVEVRHLEAFLLVAEELNFTHAAERLHLAQQALSARIRQLEDRLGAELFRRDTRSVELTAAGEAVAEHAPTIVDPAPGVKHPLAGVSQPPVVTAVSRA